jgi:hypothetical protein
MMKWILAALAFFGFHRGASAPAPSNNSGNSSTNAPTTAPTQAPHPAPQEWATDGKPVPPGCH